MHHIQSFLSTMLIVFICSTLIAQSGDGNNPPEDGVIMDKTLQFASLTFSLHDRKSDNEQGLTNFYVVNKSISWGVSLDYGFIFKPNVGVGLGVSYDKSDMENTTRGITGIPTDNVVSSNEYTIRPFIKNFIPIDKGNRFFIINQTELSYTYDKTEKSSTYLGKTTDSESIKNAYGIGIRPGLLIFLYKNFGFEANINVLGIKSSTTKTTTTDEPDSKISSTDIDFKLAILNLTFSFSLYF